MNRPQTRRAMLRTSGLALAMGLAGCASGSGAPDDETTTAPPAETTTTSTTTEPEPTTTTTTDQSGPTVAMRTDNQGSYFHPKGLLVDPGATVTFVNESGAHATAAYHPDNDEPRRIPEGADNWASKTYSESGAEFTVTLDTPGVYDYYCPPHEVLGMVGRIVVGEPQGGPGTTDPADIPPSARESLPSIDAIVENGKVDGP